MGLEPTTISMTQLLCYYKCIHILAGNVGQDGHVPEKALTTRELSHIVFISIQWATVSVVHC